jgi:3'-phosphoadenosine 5'-phosphosulfate sulfotransferase (PAPS reductase)/FAD synthetase
MRGDNYPRNFTATEIERILRLEQEALENIKLYTRDKKAVIAFSGGKDSIVVASLASKCGILEAICETSFVFPRDGQDYIKASEHLGLNCTFRDSLDYQWLRDNPEHIFNAHKKGLNLRYLRQQVTINKYSNEVGADVLITGRRDEENTCKSIYYTKSNGIGQLHPLKHWKTDDIWNYLNYNNIFVPEIYNTRHGAMYGAAAWINIAPEKYLKKGINFLEVLQERDPAFFKQVIINFIPEKYSEQLKEIKI